MILKTACALVLSLLLLAPAASAQVQSKVLKPTNPALDHQAKLLPDLVVVSIDFKDYKTFTSSGVKKASIIPSVTYKNQGPAASGAFQLAWEYFDYGTNTWRFWLQSTFLTNGGLAAGASFVEGGHLADEFGWTIGSQWPKFRCRLDVNNAVTESNEDNNETARTFSPLTPSKVPDFPVIKK